MAATLKFHLAILAVCILQTVFAAENKTIIDPRNLFGFSPRRDLPFHELVVYDGYNYENHTVTTSDGYILSLYRIPRNSSCPDDPDRLPLMFMHGLYLSGDDCIIPGPGNAHCYIYADACYDVWVPNVRGNRYSRKHVTLNPDKDSEFWDFAMDEMALIDLPAFIDYVLEHTGKTQLSYVAHSQGVGICLLLCAKKPEYNDKIHAGFGLSVTASLEHSRFLVIPIQALVAGTTPFSLSNFEILANGKFVQSTGELLCGQSPLQYPFCSFLIFAVLGYNRFEITEDTLHTLTGHVPAGTSFKNFARWGQMREHGFINRDYGPVKNLMQYGRFSAPDIDLSSVNMPWYFIASENDYVGDVRDIKALEPQLGDVKMCILADKTFGHLDFIYGRNIPNYITPKILSVLDGKPFECNGTLSSHSAN